MANVLRRDVRRYVPGVLVALLATLAALFIGEVLGQMTA